MQRHTTNSRFEWVLFFLAWALAAWMWSSVANALVIIPEICGSASYIRTLAPDKHAVGWGLTDQGKLVTLLVGEDGRWAIVFTYPKIAGEKPVSSQPASSGWQRNGETEDMVVPKSRVYIDCFSVGIDEVPRRAKDYEAQVIDILRRQKRFSVFEATAHTKIATLMTRLCKKNGRVETDNSCGDPWTRVVAIDGIQLEQ